MNYKFISKLVASISSPPLCCMNREENMLSSATYNVVQKTGEVKERRRRDGLHWRLQEYELRTYIAGKKKEIKGTSGKF